MASIIIKHANKLCKCNTYLLKCTKFTNFGKMFAKKRTDFIGIVKTKNCRQKAKKNSRKETVKITPFSFTVDSNKNITAIYFLNKNCRSYIKRIFRGTIFPFC